MLGRHAEPEPDATRPRCELDPARASKIVKGFALHLGAVQAGICRADSRWAYSHRGEIFYDNWEGWGKELPEPLPYAVVIATEMDRENVDGGPHTPAVVESGTNYAKGPILLHFWPDGLRTCGAEPTRITIVTTTRSWYRWRLMQDWEK